MSSGTVKEKMVVDGVRNPEDISHALQPIIDGASQVFLPPVLQFRFFAGYNAWLKVSHPEHAIPDDEMTGMEVRLPGLLAGAMVFYCHRNADNQADVVLTGQLAWEYACLCRKTWKYDGVVFNPTRRMKLADRGLARPAGFYAMRLPKEDRSAGIGKRFQRMAVQSVRQTLIQDWGMASEGLQIMAITHPHYPELMDGNKIPFIDLPGLAVDPDGVGSFIHAPCLRFHDGELGLYCFRVEGANPGYGSGSLQQC